MNICEEKIEAQITKYISKVIVNTSKNYIRTMYQLYEKELQLGDLFDEIDVNQNGLESNVHNNDPYKFFNKIESSEFVIYLSKTLTDKEKLILILKFFFEKTDSEIAKKFGITRQGVTNFKIRLYKKIRRNLCGFKII